MTEPTNVRNEIRKLSTAIHHAIDPARPDETAKDCAEYDTTAELCMAKVPHLVAYLWFYIGPTNHCPQACPCFRRRA